MAVWADSVPGRVSSALGAGAFFLSEGLVGPTWAGIRRGRKLIRWCPDSPNVPSPEVGGIFSARVASSYRTVSTSPLI